MIRYATYFDRHYLARGLALYESLSRHSTPFVMWILCLDDETWQVLTTMRLAHARLVRIADLESADPELAAAKLTRLAVEYYWTCGPAFLVYVFERDRDADTLTYLDADVFCFSSPEDLREELDGHSILLTPHGKALLPDDPRQVGIFNVGLIGFRRTPGTLACLARWRAQCIEWCFDRHDDGKYGDQAYLDDWPNQLPDTARLRHEGAGVAPWNVLERQLTLDENKVIVGRDPLMFYHFGRIRRVNRWLYEMHDWRFHRRRVPSIVRRGIYVPYVQSLQAAERRILANGGRLYPGRIRHGTENHKTRQELAKRNRLPLFHRLRRFLAVTPWFSV